MRKMFELLVVPEPFLKEQFYVYFTENWDKKWSDRFFEVVLTQQIKFDLHGIVPTGRTWDIVFLDQGLVPENPKTLYEILIGFKGYGLCYPRLPSTDWYLKLEKAGFVPDPASDTYRYLGCYTPDEMPYTQPKLRAYCIKDMEPPVLRFYAESVETHEKIVAKFIVNRCRVEPVPEEIERKLRAKKIPFRKIKHYSLLKW